MAYRRRHGISRSSTFKEELYRPPDGEATSSSSAPSSPLASHAIRTSDTYRGSPLASGHVNSPFHSSFQPRSKERGPIVLEKRPQDIQETWKSKTTRTETNNEKSGTQNEWQDSKVQPANPQTNHEHQLKASRDVAIATAAKAKLLLREIKTVKADLAFAKQRSSQLEEENKMLREAREKGDNPEDDDMIRLQLETLLAEKARLANENAVYLRENSCLREIIEYHKLTMQDVVYLDEHIEEVAEVNPGISRTLSVSPPLPSSPEQRSSFPSKETPLIPESVNVPTPEDPPNYPSPPTEPLKGSLNHDGTT